MMVRVFLGLGSNLGDRFKNLEQAFYELADHPLIAIIDQSSIYETEPVGFLDQDKFLNMVVAVATDLTPQELLTYVNKVEERLGRAREEHWGPRTIDIDILMYGDEVVEEDNLVIPHELMHERLFVLLPLYEIYQGPIPGVDRSIANLIIDRKEELAGISMFHLV